MAYDLYDFTESLLRVTVAGTIERCTLGFGYSPEDYGSWVGGFVCKTTDGWVLIQGWCDTTGWGCQDGANVDVFDREPTPEEVRAAFIAYCGEWGLEALDSADVDPADINRWLSGEVDRWGNPR